MDISLQNWTYWSYAMEGVLIRGTVDGQRITCILEGRVLARHFGVENDRWAIQKAFARNGEFMWEMLRDAIERGMLDERNELLLGEDELMPYLEKHTPTAATAPA